MLNAAGRCVVIFLLTLPVRADYLFTNPGPGGGSDLWTLVFHPTDPNTFYVGGDIEGPFKTTDGGQSYIRVATGLQTGPFPTGVNASQDFGVSPTDPETVYLATWSGIYKTTNGASSWSLVHPEQPLIGADEELFSAVAVSPHDGNLVLAGNGNPFENTGGISQIARTTDGGDTWQLINLTDGPLEASDVTVHRIVFDPLSSGVVYAATGEGIIKSEDSGQTWSLMNAGLANHSDGGKPIAQYLVGVIQDDEFVLFTTLRNNGVEAHDGGGVFRSLNGAESWQDISGNLPTFGSESGMAYSFWRVAVDPFNPNNVIVGTQRNYAFDQMGLYKTANALTSNPTEVNWDWLWSRNNDQVPVTDWGWLDPQFWNDQHIHHVGYSPVTPDLVYAGSVNIYRSENNGLTFSERFTQDNGDGTYTGRGIELMEVFDVTVDPNDADTWWIGYDDMGLFRTTDGGQSFQPMDSTQGPDELNGTDCACQVIVDPDDSNTIYMVRYGGDSDSIDNWRTGYLYKSTDGGGSWNQLGPGQVEGGRPSLLMLSGGTISTRTLIVTIYGTGIFKSTDSGNTWTSINSGISSADLVNLWSMAQHPNSPNTIFLGSADRALVNNGYQGAIYRSVDGGTNWTALSGASIPTGQILDLTVNNSGTLFAATTSIDSYLFEGEGTSAGGVYRSDDDGATWSRVLNQPRIDGVAVHPTDSDTVVAIVSSYWNQLESENFASVQPGMYVSRDEGLTWQLENNGLTYNFFWFIKADPLTPGRFFMGTRGGGFFSASEGTNATQYLMTNSASQNVTTLHVINSSSAQQNFTGTLYNGDGERLGNANQPLHSGTINPNGRLLLTAAELEQIFSTDVWQGPAMLEVFGNGAFELMSKLVSPSGLVSNTNCVRESRVMNIEGTDSDNRTFIRFINTTDSTINGINGTLYDENGDIIGIQNTELIASLIPKQQIWINRDQFADLVGSSWTGTAMLDVGSVPGLKLLNLNFVNNETFFNFSCFENSDGGAIYLMTNSASANVSFTHIINTDAAPQQFLGTLYDGAGNRLGESLQPLHSGMIESRGRTIISALDLESIFDTETWSGPAILEVSGSGSFEMMTRLTSPSGLVSNTNCVRRNEVHNIEGSDSMDQTFVRFINTGNTTLTDIQGSLYNNSGDSIGNNNTVLLSSLQPKAASWVNRTQLASLIGDEWTGEATLKIAEIEDLRLLNLNFVNGETFFNFSCYEGN